MDRMNRRSVLEGFGFLGITALTRGLAAPANAFVPATVQKSALTAIAAPACWLTPEKTEGPYYFDPALIRRDITEGKTGVPLTLGIGVVDSNCVPVPGLLVDVWHCDKDGLYSGYSQPGGNTRGQTFLRGTQPTGADGIAIFDTIYPGWYQGRATHIHFKVRIPDQTYITSQFAFQDATNDAVYATSLYAARGRNPTTNARDGIFGSADPTYLEVDVTPNGSGYDGAFAVGLGVALAGGLHAVSKCRILDTRLRNGDLGGPALQASKTRIFHPTGHCEVPAGAKALVADIAVLQARKAGRLQIFPAGAEAGSGANLTFGVPRTSFGGVRIPLDADGEMAVRSTRPVHMMMNVTGYYD